MVPASDFRRQDSNLSLLSRGVVYWTPVESGLHPLEEHIALLGSLSLPDRVYYSYLTATVKDAMEKVNRMDKLSPIFATE